MKRGLLICGILSSMLYVGMNVLVPLNYPGYDFASQTVSELSAIGAPTRRLWLILGSVYAVLYACFGIGVRRFGGSNRTLRAAGGSILLMALLSVYWPPMHMRGEAFTFTDVLHIAWTMATVILMVSAIALAAISRGRRFQIYSVATISVMLIFGTVTGLSSSRISMNLPTPWVGVWERVSIAAFLLWVALFAANLLRDRQPGTHFS